MKIYYAGSGYDDIVYRNGGSKLVTFAEKSMIFNWWTLSNNTPCFLDSGAFSAFTTGKEINIDEYIAFIKENEWRIDTYAVLDVIGDHKGTQANQEYMESKGLKPLPVFHVGSPLEDLELMVQKYDYIALGGLVPHAMNRPFLREWLDNCFSIIRDRCKVHGFGVNAKWAWERYPFFTVDATSWLSGAKFGSLRIEGKKYTKSSQSIIGMQLHIVHYRDKVEMQLQDYQLEVEKINALWSYRGIDWKN